MKKNKLKKFIIGIVLINIINLLFLMVSFGEWIQSGEKWQYSDRGEMIVGDFKQIDGAYYYFDENGNMVTGIMVIDGDFYAFGVDGKAMKDGIVLFNTKYNCTLKGKVLKADELDKTVEECNAWLLENNKKEELAVIHTSDNMMSEQLGMCSDGEVVGWNKIGAEYRIVDNNGRKKAHDYADITEATQLTNTVYFDDNGNIRPLNWKNVDGNLKLILDAGQAEYYKEYVYINGMQCKYVFAEKAINEDDYTNLISRGFDENTYCDLVRNDLEQTYQKELVKAENQKKQDLINQQNRQKQAEIQNRRKLKGYKKTANGSSIPVIEGDDEVIINSLIENNYINLVLQYVLDYYDSEVLDDNYENIVLTTQNVSIYNYEDGQMDMTVTVKFLSRSLVVTLVYDPVKKDFIYSVNK